MEIKNLKLFLSLLIFAAFYQLSFGQESVPLGIHYQAVARDNNGKEIANKDIDVMFSIISGNPLGTVAYQELHSKIITSKYGVFSLIIGHGTPTGGIYGELSQIKWSNAYHYLKVEVKFESIFIDMGTMQFLAVPYALFARKSLEPGPQGQKGDAGLQGIQGIQGVQGLQGLKGDTGTQGVKGDTGPQGVKGDTGTQGVKGDTGPQGPQGVQGQKGDAGDPATDDQTLSFDGTNLSISVGNNGTASTVNISTLNVAHSLSVLGDTLSIMGGNKVELPNQIQDLHLDLNNILKIDKNTNATPIDLTRFLDDKQQLSFNNSDSSLSITNGTASVDLSVFNQKLSFNSSDNKLSLSGAKNLIDLTILRDDADHDPENEIQDLQLDLNNILKIDKNTNATPIDLNRFLDDKQQLSFNNSDSTLSITNGTASVDLSIFNQKLSFNPSDNKLSLSGAKNLIDLTILRDDADHDPGNEIQDLQLIANKLSITGKSGAQEINMNDYLDNTDNQTLGYNELDKTLTISNGTPVVIGRIIAFRAGIAATVNLADNLLVDLVFNQVSGTYYSDGTYYNPSIGGGFTAPYSGIYSFSVNVNLPANCSVIIKVFGNPNETIIGPTASSGNYRETITLKLNEGVLVNIAVIQTNGYLIPFGFAGSFSGFRVY